MQEEIIIAGTGHRPNKLGGYGPEIFMKLFHIAVQYLLAQSDREKFKIVTGMALGWDMALAHAARELNIPFIAAVPFKGQESRWPEESQDLYHDLLSHAFKIVIVSEGGYSPEKMQIRNKWMVDHSHKILAMFDGSKGGTYNCIKYAQQQGKPIINLYDKL